MYVVFMSLPREIILRLLIGPEITWPVQGQSSWIVPAWSLKNKKVFRIGLVDRPHVEPWKQGGVPYWTCGSSPLGALKRRRCSGLDLWIVPAWSLKNEEVFRIGLVDLPCVEPLKKGGVPEWTRGFPSHGAFKTRRCSDWTCGSSPCSVSDRPRAEP